MQPEAVSKMGSECFRIKPGNSCMFHWQIWCISLCWSIKGPTMVPQRTSSQFHRCSGDLEITKPDPHLQNYLPLWHQHQGILPPLAGWRSGGWRGSRRGRISWKRAATQDDSTKWTVNGSVVPEAGCLMLIDVRRDPERGLQSWFRPAKPETETRNRLWRLNFPRADRNPKTETRNSKPTVKVGFELRNPKPETRNRQRKWVSIDETRNPKPETDSESWFQATKPETRNPKPTAKVGFNRRNPKPETRNPKPETDSNPTFGWLSGSELIDVGSKRVPFWIMMTPSNFILLSPTPLGQVIGFRIAPPPVQFFRIPVANSYYFWVVHKTE